MLAINEEFLSIQGEGHMTGTLMYFVRTQGCSVGCHFCDSKPTWKNTDKKLLEYDIIDRAVASGAEWICLTGGEPLEQDVTDLVKIAHNNNLKVHVETSGHFFIEDAFKRFDHVTVSPKDLFSTKSSLDEKCLIYAGELKCVVVEPKHIEYYLNRFKDFIGLKYLQPVDNNKELAGEILARLPKNWKLSCQTQKILNLR